MRFAPHPVRILFALSALFAFGAKGPLQSQTPEGANPTKGRYEVQLRNQVETKPAAGRFHRLQREEVWDASKTAIIVCDMWDSHHCYRAVLREQEFAPRLNDVLTTARKQGTTIIHSPSGCMSAYAEHPARRRASQTSAAHAYPADISKWCYQIPAEEAATYPIDQTDGGEDDTPEEHAAWEKQLAAQGRDVKAPWQRQIDVIEIDPQSDFISDDGKEIWNVLQDRGIRQVILAGVHTNMCVLGRPFGLRRMKLAGMNVALMRDLTDTMYNPAAKPFVSHFSGTDLIVDHIERYVCPTLTSDQIIGGSAFRFADDHRPHVAMLINEPEYQTEITLPRFVEKHLRRDHRITLVYGSEPSPDEFPGIGLIAEADALLVSVRRRTPPPEQLAVVRDFVSSGKPVIGIRTASHAFALRSGSVPAGASDWPGFDAQVFGGHYTNHHGNNKMPSLLRVDQTDHAILAGVELERFKPGGSLYVVSPVNANATVLLQGEIQGSPPEPVAWTFERADGGQSFYTSLGAPADFEQPAFEKLLRNAVDWAVQRR